MLDEKLSGYNCYEKIFATQQSINAGVRYFAIT